MESLEESKDGERVHKEVSKSIRESIAKNWNLWLCHIKQRSGKKVGRILWWWYRDWRQSMRGMTREVPQCLLLLYESKQGPKKGTRRPTEIAKNTKLFIKRSSIGHFGTSPIPKCTVFKTLQRRDRDVAPKPIKWSFKNDFADRYFCFFQKIGTYGYKIGMAICRLKTEHRYNLKMKK